MSELPIENFIQTVRARIQRVKSLFKAVLKRLFEASGLYGTRESNMAANSSSGPEFNRHAESLPPQQLNKKGKHEKSAFKYGVGNCGHVSMVTSLGDYEMDYHEE